eukprot:m51a1_g11367 hypothetical protein (900) ;mRNA; f:14738-22761
MGGPRAAAERTLQALVDSTPEFGKDVEMRLVETTEDPHVAGWPITTHQQTIDGIPIVGAVLKAVWNSEGEVVSVTGTTVADAHERTHLRARTAVSQEEAVGVAQRAAGAKDGQARCVEARRVVLRPGMANGEPGPNLPAWEVVCGTADVYVSTQSPSVLALNPRKSHLVSEVLDEPSGELLWKSGQGSSSDPEINSVVDGIAIAERIWKSFSGRDCYDNKGSTITAFMHLNMSNAYYQNRTMSFGLEFVSRSIMWHEYAHGITDFLDKLWYEAQSGALNEAWSDIFSGAIDIVTNSHTVRADEACPTDDSLIPGHTFAMLTDGSTKHGVTGVGINASMKIFTRAKYLSTPMTTFALYASYLTVACEQLKDKDGSITASTCSSLAGAIAATELSGPIPCFSIEPSIISGPTVPVTPRVFVKGADNSHFTLFIKGNFTGATLRWSGGSTGLFDMSSVKAIHLDPTANVSNPIWIYQVQCPVPASLNTEEDVVINLDGSSASQDFNITMYWAAMPVLDKALFVATDSIDIYSQNFLTQASNFVCVYDVEQSFIVPCIMVFLCNQEINDPAMQCDAIMDVVFRTDVPGVLRATAPPEIFTRGKYFVYVSQHGLAPISNAASFTVKNANASMRICFDLKDVHVVVAEAVFGSVDADTDSSGCVTFDLEQSVEYNVTATKDKYLGQTWQQTLTNSTVALLRTAGPFAAAVKALELAIRGAVILLIVGALSALLAGFKGAACNAVVHLAVASSNPTLTVLLHKAFVGCRTCATAEAGIVLVAVLNTAAAFAIPLFDGVGCVLIVHVEEVLLDTSEFKQGGCEGVQHSTVIVLHVGAQVQTDVVEMPQRQQQQKQDSRISYGNCTPSSSLQTPSGIRSTDVITILEVAAQVEALGKRADRNRVKRRA